MYGPEIAFSSIIAANGAQVATRNSKGEADKIDEVICPVDFDYDDNTKMIRDKDFVRLFKTLPAGVEFIWVSDSCFSGGLAHGFLKLPESVTSLKYRNCILPEDITWRNETAKENTFSPLGINKSATDLNVALISGCNETQESADAEINGRFNSALTYYLLEQLKTRNGLTEPLSNLCTSVEREIKAKKFTQTPELLGSKILGKNPFLK